MRVALLCLAVAKELRRDGDKGLRLGYELDVRALAERTDDARAAAHRGQRLEAHCGVPFAALPAAAYAASPEGDWGVVEQGGQWAIQELSGAANPVATGHFSDATETGWSQVRMSFQPSSGASLLEAADTRLSDAQKMYAAGYLEGALTAHHIADFYSNTELSTRDRSTLNEVFGSQLEMMASKVGKADPWDHHRVCAACQLVGLADGYSARRAAATAAGGALLEGGRARFPELSVLDIMRLNADGQIDELKQLLPYGELKAAQAELDAVDASGMGGAPAVESVLAQTAAKIRPVSFGPPGDALLEVKADSSAEQWPAPNLENPKPGRCSALIKYTGKNLMFAHTTFEDYKEQVRYWKHYDFPINGMAASKLSFSSYPGCISSTDDFIVSDKGLVATETTTNTRKEEALHHFLKTPHEPDYVTMLGSMRMASSGKELVEHFIGPNGKFASGTYASQWMVGDYGAVQEDGTLGPGAVHIMETGPGVEHPEAQALLEVAHTRFGEDAQMYETTHGAAVVMDASNYLMNKKNYWGSYNEPVFLDGIMGSSNDPRQHIFDEHAPHVESMRDVMALMRRNNKLEDHLDGVPIDYNQAIAARADLGPYSSNFGGTDTKVVDRSLMEKMQVAAVAGPTAVVDGECRPFEWQPEDYNGIRGIKQKMFYDWYLMGDAAPQKYADGCFQAKTPQGATPGKSLLDTTAA